MSSLRVLGNSVLVIPYRQKVTDSGILIPTSVQEKQIISICIVSVVGPDVKDTENIKEGAVVIIPRKTGKWVPFEGFKYILVNENDILAVMDGAVYTPIDETTV